MEKGPATSEVVIAENAKSVAFRELPPPKENLNPDDVSILLFYQYVEPDWTPAEHRAALKKVIAIGNAHNIKGRGRCAPEGLNCTLSGSAEDIRKFCYSLREWNPIFNETDFKIEDGISADKGFKALTITKQTELVAYGLEGEKAPSLKYNGAKHLEALDYHKMMEQPDTVIIDVRNAYETALGRFQPPKGGAEFLDPKMRNSHEFPKWLNSPETKQKLQGKKVMMYCTGGIRCERATALLHQMETVQDDIKTKGIYMARGGIDRYIKTFAGGGYWQGKNFLFDKRKEQMGEMVSEKEVDKNGIETWCCICQKPWEKYIGRHKCSVKLCKVPVLVCTECIALDKPKDRFLRCPLCEEGYDLRGLPLPDLKKERQMFLRKVAKEGITKEEAVEKRKKSTRHWLERKANKRKKLCLDAPSQILFVGNLPFVVNVGKIKHAFGGKVLSVSWIVDPKSKMFYGSAFVKVDSREVAKQIVEKANLNNNMNNKGIKSTTGGISIMGRRLRIGYISKEKEQNIKWPIREQEKYECPPIPAR